MKMPAIWMMTAMIVFGCDPESSSTEEDASHLDAEVEDGYVKDQFRGRCGDGIVSGDEECDDRRGGISDGCHECRIVICGDGVIEEPEECDDGNGFDEDTCDNNCRHRCVSVDFPFGSGVCEQELSICISGSGCILRGLAELARHEYSICDQEERPAEECIELLREGHAHAERERARAEAACREMWVCNGATPEAEPSP